MNKSLEKLECNTALETFWQCFVLIQHLHSAIGMLHNVSLGHQNALSQLASINIQAAVSVK